MWLQREGGRRHQNWGWGWGWLQPWSERAQKINIDLGGGGGAGVEVNCREREGGRRQHVKISHLSTICQKNVERKITYWFCACFTHDWREQSVECLQTDDAVHVSGCCTFILWYFSLFLFDFKPDSATGSDCCFLELAKLAIFLTEMMFNFDARLRSLEALFSVAESLSFLTICFVPMKRLRSNSDRRQGLWVIRLVESSFRFPLILPSVSLWNIICKLNMTSEYRSVCELLPVYDMIGFGEEVGP